MSRNRNPIEVLEWQVANARKNKRYDRERVTVNSGDIETLIAELVEVNRKLEAIRELTEPNDWVHPELILEALGLLEDPDLSYPTLDSPVPVVLDTEEGES